MGEELNNENDEVVEKCINKNEIKICKEIVNYIKCDRTTLLFKCEDGDKDGRCECYWDIKKGNCRRKECKDITGEVIETGCTEVNGDECFLNVFAVYFTHLLLSKSHFYHKLIMFVKCVFHV
jgi:hypothetical protein